MLALKKMNFASLADQQRVLIGELAVDLAAAVQRHWLTQDTSTDWERAVRDAQQAASVPGAEAANVAAAPKRQP